MPVVHSRMTERSMDKFFTLVKDRAFRTATKEVDGTKFDVLTFIEFENITRAITLARTMTQGEVSQRDVIGVVKGQDSRVLWFDQRYEKVFHQSLQWSGFQSY